jgi:hypothetical protein
MPTMSNPYGRPFRRRKVAALRGKPPCSICGEPIRRPEQGTLHHDPPVVEGGNVFSEKPAHKWCNARHGGRLGAARSGRRRDEPSSSCLCPASSARTLQPLPEGVAGRDHAQLHRPGRHHPPGRRGHPPRGWAMLAVSRRAGPGGSEERLRPRRLRATDGRERRMHACERAMPQGQRAEPVARIGAGS